MRLFGCWSRAPHRAKRGTAHRSPARRAYLFASRSSSIVAALSATALAGCNRGSSQPSGVKPLTVVSADAGVAIPPPPPRPQTPSAQDFAQLRAQVDSIPLNADPRLLMETAAMARKLGDVWRTEQVLRELLRRYPKDAMVRTRLAFTLEGEMCLPEARSLYEGVLKENPKDVRAYVGLANVAFGQHKRDEAWQWLERGADACATSGADLLAIGHVYLSWDDFASADRVLRKAQDAAPVNTSIVVERGTLLVRSGKPDEAKTLLTALVDHEPRNALGWKVLARAWSASLGDPNRAVGAEKAAEMAVLLNPKDAEARRYAAHVFRKLGHKRRAAQEFAQALAASPNHIESRYALAQLYGELGKRDWMAEQLGICKQIAEVQHAQQTVVGHAVERPTDWQVRLALGRCMEKQGDFPGAVREYQIASRFCSRHREPRTALEALYDRMAWNKATLAQAP